ncbi:MAG: hypothetical protein HXX14_13505 [Bacteroidetes bacterium]|nr:hypothetical protein [Bacteroidota bacterium]
MFCLKRKALLLASLSLLLCIQNVVSQKKKTDEPEPEGSKIKRVHKQIPYPDGRPHATYYINPVDVGIVFKHGNGPENCDIYGARDVWVWEHERTFYMHYDGAGPKGWVTCLAKSEDLQNWKPMGKVMDLGEKGSNDCASASYGTTFFDKGRWHMFYLGTPHTSPAPDLIPAFPYLTMKAESNSSTGPWEKQYNITPFKPKENTYYSATASPGQIIKQGNDYLMFFSASTDKPIKRTIGIARTHDLNGTWEIAPTPIVPIDEQIENTSIYYEPTNKTWFLFTNHVGEKDGLEYTDAIWLYWTKDLNKWDAKHKAIVLDSKNCKWSKQIIGLPSVVQVDTKLVLFYDGNRSPLLPQGNKSHMNRDIGMAWLRLPIMLPE